MSIENLHLAVKIAGGQAALARAIGRGIKQPHVWTWLNSPNPNQMPPAEYCPAIEKATGVKCEDLRPDIEWSVLRVGCDCKEAA
jgi:DNA-binding transcriptional regulator YdaS (Cro superfamily)